ncbi:MAG: alpha-glucosidase/alpha-galactosidase [Desulfurococcaceae archaeon]
MTPLERLKIAFIGAGSAVWSSTIVVDLLINRRLRDRVDIWLMDIDPWRLEVIYGFTKRYIEELRAGAQVYKTFDRREAIKDADFVVNSAMARGHGYYELLREVSEKHGYYRGINSVEWNYVSDYHTIWGYYQFKLFTDILEDIEELSPNAWFINVANPVFELSTLAFRKSKVKYIGLCHGHLGYLKSAVLVLGMRLAKEKGVNIVSECAAEHPECYLVIQSLLSLEELEVEMVGFNHVIWLTKFKYKGEDAYKYLDDWIKEDAEHYWKVWREHTYNPFDIDLSPAAVDMYRTYGLLPIGDTVRGGTWKYHWDLKTKQYWYGPYGGPDSEIGWSMYIAHLRIKLRELASNVFDLSTPLTSRYPPKPSGESLVEIIDSLANNVDKDRYELYLPIPGSKPIPVPIQVNTVNNGVLVGVPDNVAVEVPARLTGRSIEPVVTTSLPSKVLKYVMMHRLMRAEWAIEAFLSGGREHLFNWLIVDPRTKSTRQVEEVIDAILKLPENEEMAKHFS